MKKLGILLTLVAPVAIAACTVQIVQPTPVTPDVETHIRASAKPEPAPSGKPSAVPTPTLKAGSFTTGEAYVKSYECVSTAKPGAPITLKVHYGLPDPSWGFDKLSVEVDEAAKVIHVKPTMTRRNPGPGEPGIVAPAVIVESSASTELTIKTPGRYTFSSSRYLSDPPKTEIVIAESELRPLLTLMSHGGLCPTGTCSRTIEVMSDGTFTVTSGDTVTNKGELQAETLEALRHEIEKADFTALKAVPFTETCPTAFDGSENVYTFHTATGSEKLASCTIKIDQEAPLFQAVASVVKVVDAPK